MSQVSHKGVLIASRCQTHPQFFILPPSCNPLVHFAEAADANQPVKRNVHVGRMFKLIKQPKCKRDGGWIAGAEREVVFDLADDLTSGSGGESDPFPVGFKLRGVS